MNPKLVFAAGCLAACTAQAAGNGYLVLPVAPVLEQPETQRVLGGMPVRFGIAPIVGPDTGTPVTVMSWARPGDVRGWGGTVSRLPDGRPVPLTREQTCQLALRYTLENLVNEARQKGAQAVVDVVSYNDEVEMNSPTSFECIPGVNSSTVNLKGRALARQP